MNLKLITANSSITITELINDLEDLELLFAEKFISYEIAIKL